MLAQTDLDQHPLVALVHRKLAEAQRLPTRTEYETVTLTCGRSLYIISAFGWGTPCHEMMDMITEYATAPLVEIGAGTGFISHVLGRYGHDVVATDAYHLSENEWFNAGTATLQPKAWCRVLPIAAEQALRMHKNRDVVLSWPTNPMPDPATGEADPIFADLALALMKPGRHLFLLGDTPLELAGGEPLRKVLATEFKELTRVSCPRWQIKPHRKHWQRVSKWPWLRMVATPAEYSSETCWVFERR